MAKLGEVCTIVSGSTPKTSVTSYWDGNIKWITPAELNEDTFYIMDSVRHITEEGKEKTGLSYLPTGTVILSSRAPIGKTAIAGCKMCCNQGFKNLICSDAIYNEYLYFFLKSKTDYLNSLGRGATFKEISKSIVESIEIPLPEVNQQKEIAEKFKKLEQLISLRKQQLAKLDELVKARFVEMFGNKDYPRMKWNNVFNTTTGKLDSNAAVDNGKYPFFTCSKEPLKIDSYAFDQTALLLAGNNAAGKYDVKYYQGKFNAYQRTYVLSLKHNWSYKLFQYQLEDKLLYLQTKSLGGLTKYLTLKILGELDFIVPPLALQNEFATFVARIDQQKQTVQQSLEKLELMRKALMQEYFG